jgi:hypothetical protein
MADSATQLARNLVTARAKGDKATFAAAWPGSDPEAGPIPRPCVTSTGPSASLCWPKSTGWSAPSPNTSASNRPTTSQQWRRRGHRARTGRTRDGPTPTEPGGPCRQRTGLASGRPQRRPDRHRRRSRRRVQLRHRHRGRARREAEPADGHRRARGLAVVWTGGPRVDRRHAASWPPSALAVLTVHLDNVGPEALGYLRELADQHTKRFGECRVWARRDASDDLKRWITAGCPDAGEVPTAEELAAASELHPPVESRLERAGPGWETSEPIVEEVSA